MKRQPSGSIRWHDGHSEHVAQVMAYRHLPKDAWLVIMKDTEETTWVGVFRISVRDENLYEAIVAPTSIEQAITIASEAIVDPEGRPAHRIFPFSDAATAKALAATVIAYLGPDLEGWLTLNTEPANDRIGGAA